MEVNIKNLEDTADMVKGLDQVNIEGVENMKGVVEILD